MTRAQRDALWDFVRAMKENRPLARTITPELLACKVRGITTSSQSGAPLTLYFLPDPDDVVRERQTFVAVPKGWRWADPATVNSVDSHEEKIPFGILLERVQEQGEGRSGLTLVYGAEEVYISPHDIRQVVHYAELGGLAPAHVDQSLSSSDRSRMLDDRLLKPVHEIFEDIHFIERYSIFHGVGEMGTGQQHTVIEVELTSAGTEDYASYIHDRLFMQLSEVYGRCSLSITTSPQPARPPSVQDIVPGWGRFIAKPA